MKTVREYTTCMYGCLFIHKFLWICMCMQPFFLLHIILDSPVLYTGTTLDTCNSKSCKFIFTLCTYAKEFFFQLHLCVCVCVYVCVWPNNVCLHTYWSNVFVKRTHSACSSPFYITRDVCLIVTPTVWIDRNTERPTPMWWVCTIVVILQLIANFMWL